MIQYRDRQRQKAFIGAIIGAAASIAGGIIKGNKQKKAQEKAQAEINVTPVYKTLNEWGPDHAKHFQVGVYLGDNLIAEGEGTSKRLAEQEAAKKALEGWQSLEESTKQKKD